MRDSDNLKKHFISTLFKIKRIDMCGNLNISLPLGEMVILRKLFSSDCHSGNCMSTSELHRDLYISKPAVSQILNSLENKGYINRYIDTNDRRRIMISATASAYDELKKTEQAIDEKMNRIADEFGEKNIESLTEQLTLLYDIYEKIDKDNNNTK